MGNSEEMQKAIEMLAEVKESIINAYEIKTNMSRAKISHLMDAETWMDANKAVELGFADEIMKRADDNESLDAPEVSMLYSQAAITNSLMDKIAAKCRIQQKIETKEHSVDDYLEQLNNKKFHVSSSSSAGRDFPVKSASSSMARNTSLFRRTVPNNQAGTQERNGLFPAKPESQREHRGEQSKCEDARLVHKCRSCVPKNK
jgi:hypothetical protein